MVALEWSRGDISKAIHGSDPASGSGQQVFEKPADRVALGQEVLGIARVEWGRRVSRLSNITGWAGSPRVGPGRHGSVRVTTGWAGSP